MTEAFNYDNIYSTFSEHLLETVHHEVFGENLGQNSWLTAEELRKLLSWLDLSPQMIVLDVCCGSGGPSLFVAGEFGCRVFGIDQSESGIANAKKTAEARSVQNARFDIADASRTLPFEMESLDVIISIDSINHLPDRSRLFADWFRVLKPGGRILFTDPITVTGSLTSDEVAIRSWIGPMIFTPKGVNESLLEEARFNVLRCEDATENATFIARRRHEVREKYRDGLIEIEGEAAFVGMQRFLEMVHRLSSERRLSRFAYLALKPKSP